MKINKKVTDFITLEEGNIGRKAAVVTGALLASSVLGLALTTQVTKAAECAQWETHTHNQPIHTNVSHSDTHTDTPAHDDYWHDEHCDGA